MFKKLSITKKISIGFLFILLSFFGFNFAQYKLDSNEVKEKLKSTQNIKEAYFAGGCFWCVESSFEKYKEYGVIDVVSGYAGGTVPNPTYEEVLKGDTGHREAVKIIYDADRIDYNDLLQILWRTANPTDPDGQYVDRGFSYTSAIFYQTEEEKNKAIKSKKDLQESGRYGDKEVITPIIKYTNFYSAEKYHQNFYLKSVVRYNVYTNNSGRKEHLESTWGDDLYYKVKGMKEEVKKQKVNVNYKGEPLTKLQYKVTQENGTESSFDNEYWDNERDGIYVDLIDGTPLYSSVDKYKSGTGWPSFSKPIDINNLELREDRSLFSVRTEIRGKKSDSHIGHVFDDGPIDKGGLRYCMNSSALDFIAKEDLQKEGYGEYLKLFNN